jgi:hypothetical protein
MPNTAFKMISDDRTNPGVQNWRPGPGSSYQRLKSGPATGFGPGSKNKNIWISFFHKAIPFLPEKNFRIIGFCFSILRQYPKLCGRLGRRSPKKVW